MSGTLARNARVFINGDKVAGLYSVRMNGSQLELNEDTEFGDQYKTYVPWLKDSNKASFSGNFVKSDAPGQTFLRSSCETGNAIDDIRIYFDLDCFLALDSSSLAYVTNWRTGSERADLIQCAFLIDIVGGLVYVQSQSAFILSSDEDKLYPNDSDSVTGWWEADVNGDYMPRNSIDGTEYYWELDGNGDLIPI